MIPTAFLCIVLISGALAAHHETLCSNAEAACQANSTCNALRQSWRSTCADVIAGSTISCTAPCNATFDALIRHDIGRQLETCHCNATNATCEAERVNFLAACRGVAPPPAAKCPPSVEPDRPSTKTCASLSYICEANSTCRIVLHRYLTACTGAFANKVCTMNCKNRLQDLLCDPIGRMIYASRDRCICTSGDVACFAYTTYVNNLCFDIKYPEFPTDIQVCDYVTSACQLDPFSTCPFLLSNYISKCAREFGGPAPCSDGCKQAMDSLFANPIGWHYMKCSCSDQSCGAGTAYLFKNCYNMIAPVPRPCSDILGWCSNDVRCKDVGARYEDTCSPTKVSSCVEPCKTDASAIIYNPIGATLLNCFCDNDDVTCRQYRNTTLSCGFDPLMPPSTTGPPSTSSPVDTRGPSPTGGTGSLGVGSAIFVTMIASLLV